MGRAAAFVGCDPRGPGPVEGRTRTLGCRGDRRRVRGACGFASIRKARSGRGGRQVGSRPRARARPDPPTPRDLPLGRLGRGSTPQRRSCPGRTPPRLGSSAGRHREGGTARRGGRSSRATPPRRRRPGARRAFELRVRRGPLETRRRSATRRTRPGRAGWRPGESAGSMESGGIGDASR